jgi:uncharacterized protein with PQ loop repeat
MSLEVLVPISNVLQSLIVLVMLSAFVPQWITIVRNRSSQNISAASWLMYFASSIFALFYAVVQFAATGTGHALVATTTVSFFCNLYSVYLVYRFRPTHGENVSGASVRVIEEKSEKLWKGSTGYRVPESLLAEAPGFSFDAALSSGELPA